MMMMTMRSRVAIMKTMMMRRSGGGIDGACELLFSKQQQSKQHLVFLSRVTDCLFMYFIFLFVCVILYSILLLHILSGKGRACALAHNYKRLYVFISSCVFSSSFHFFFNF